MCETCFDKFKSKLAVIALPLDPSVSLVNPAHELVIEYQALSTQWRVYVQNVLRRISPQDFQHHIKKNKRPLAANIKALIVAGLKANEPPGLIARRAGVLPQTVYDQKYFIKKSLTHGSSPAALGASASPTSSPKQWP